MSAPAAAAAKSAAQARPRRRAIVTEPSISGETMELYETLCRLVREVEEDMKKATGGNKAAGTRVRKTMQEIKECAQSVRQAVLNLREAEGGQGE
jgi:hypothetical protein